MYIENVPNRNSPPAVLLRESYRQGKKILKRTLANLSDWPKQKIESLRRLLREVHKDRLSRDPVTPAQPSSSAVEKRATHTTPDGFEVHSFKTLLQAMSTRCRNTCHVKSDADSTFNQVTDPTPLQTRVLQLLGL